MLAGHKEKIILREWCSCGVGLGQGGGDTSILGDFPNPTGQGSELPALALPPALHGPSAGPQTS